MSSMSNPVFDYAQVDSDDAGKLRCCEGELVRSRKRVSEEIIKHGEILHTARAVLANYSGGVFVAWLDSVGISRGSAYNAIDAYVEFGSFPNLENLEVSAIYALTKNQRAKKKALKLASKGTKVTHAMAKQLIDESQSQETRKRQDAPQDAGHGGPQEAPESDPFDDGAEYDDADEFDEFDEAAELGLAFSPEPATVEAESVNSVVLDQAGRSVPPEKAEAHALAAAIQTEARRLDAILRRLRELSELHGGEFIEVSSIDIAVQSLKGQIFGSAYWSECPKCHGDGGECPDCRGCGWWPRRKSGHLSQADRDWLGI